MLLQVKLAFVPHVDLFLQGTSLVAPGLRDGPTRERFMCQLLAHLRWKASAPAVPQAQVEPAVGASHGRGALMSKVLGVGRQQRKGTSTVLH